MKIKNNYLIARRCPFCGKRAELKFMGTQQCDYWKGRIVTRCTNCGAEAGRIPYRGKPIMGDLMDTKMGQVALESWNKRVSGC